MGKKKQEAEKAKTLPGKDDKTSTMMETIKFYCYRDLYKTCYSLKHCRMLFSHNCAEKKGFVSPFSGRLTTDNKKKKSS